MPEKELALAPDELDDDFNYTREGPARYAAYLARIKKFGAMQMNKLAAMAKSGARYVAYSSEIGEAMRPIIPPMWVNLAYAVAIGYVGVDVAYHGHSGILAARARLAARASRGPQERQALSPPATTRARLTIKLEGRGGLYREQQKGGDVPRAVAHATVFQLLASLAVPTLVIHTVVHQTQNLTRRTGRFTKWGPTVAGLVLIPVLPFTIDEPIEYAVDTAFDKYWPVIMQAEKKESAAKAKTA